jgi:ABC-type transport system involved in cytochrome bd biosynthesis fused ATPase/permease subunit
MNKSVLIKSVSQVLSVFLGILFMLSGFLIAPAFGLATILTTLLLLGVFVTYRQNMNLEAATKAKTLMIQAGKLKSEYTQLYQSGNTDAESKLRLKAIEAELLKMQDQAEKLLAEMQ